MVGGTLDKSGIGNIYFDDRFTPLKFKDSVMLFPDGKVSLPIINYKQIEKYVVSVAINGVIYITLQPKKMGTTYEDYKKEKDSNINQ
jgi:hypothetical protein